MANGSRDPVLDEISRLGRGGGTAVAEPEEDPVLSEIEQLGKPPKQPKEDLTEAERLTRTPSGPSLSQRADRLGTLPLELPPSPVQPHLVRGQFDQPIPPLPVEQQLESERFREMQAGGPEKQEGQDLQERLGPGGRVVAAGATGLAEAVDRVGPPSKTAPLLPGVIQQFQPVLQQPLAPLEAMVPPSEKGPAASFERGLLKGVGELTTPTNIALAGGMEALPAEFATSAAGKVLLGTGFTVPMAVGLIRDVPEMRDAIVHEDWNKAAQIAGQMIPTAVFTAEGVRNVYEGIAAGVNITK